MEFLAKGTKIELYWPEQEKWTSGVVIAHRENNKYSISLEDDGFEEALTYDLDKYKFKVVSNDNTTTQTQTQQATATAPEEEMPEDVFEVECVLEKRFDQDGSISYKVKWKGYTLDECTWEPLEHLGAAKNLVDELEEKLRRKRVRDKNENVMAPPTKKAKIETQQTDLKPLATTYAAAGEYKGFWPQIPIGSDLDINFCHQWSEQDVSNWLECFDFGVNYKQSFVENAVDGRLLLEVTYPTLFDEVGVKNSTHQQQLRTAINCLKQTRKITYAD